MDCIDGSRGILSTAPKNMAPKHGRRAEFALLIFCLGGNGCFPFRPSLNEIKVEYKTALVHDNIYDISVLYMELVNSTFCLAGGDGGSY